MTKDHHTRSCFLDHYRRIESLLPNFLSFQMHLQILCMCNEVPLKLKSTCRCYVLKNSEYDQEIPQSQTADNPMAPRGRGTQPS